MGGYEPTVPLRGGTESYGPWRPAGDATRKTTARRLARGRQDRRSVYRLHSAGTDVAEGSRSVLPPPDADPVRLLSLTGRAVADTPGPSMHRLLSATAPDAVVGVGPQTPVVRAGLARDIDVDVLIPGAGRPTPATPSRSSVSPTG